MKLDQDRVSVFIVFTFALMVFNVFFVVPLTLVHESGHVIGGLIVGGEVREIVFNWGTSEPAFTNMTIPKNPVSFFITYFSGGGFAFGIFYLHYFVSRRYLYKEDIRVRILAFFMTPILLFLALTSLFNGLAEGLFYNSYKKIPYIVDGWTFASALFAAWVFAFRDMPKKGLETEGSELGKNTTQKELKKTSEIEDDQ